jgi:hypothetical protein
MTDENHDSVERKVQEILGTDVSVSNFVTLRNGGEHSFDITSKGYGGRISFSQDYLERNPDGAGRELRSMYELKKRFPQVERVVLWNALEDEEGIMRYLKSGYRHADVSPDWRNIEGDINATVLPVPEDIYLRPPSDEVTEDLVSYLCDDLSFGVERLWGLDIDVLKFESRPEWILKGGNSTIVYNPETEQFSLGGMWGKDAEVTKIDPANKTLTILDSHQLWELSLIDTHSNHRGSAYRAQEVGYR